VKRRFLAVGTAVLAGFGTAVCGTPALAADTVREKQWHLDFLNISAAQRISSGDGVTVAVVDTGVSDHPDLVGSVLDGKDFVKPRGDGRTDRDGHGTKMAGLIAGHGADGHGVWGIAPGAKILPIRVFDKASRRAEVGPSIVYAISRGAKVINLSLDDGLDPETIKAVKAAKDADVVVIAAAGNKPEEFTVASPAFLDGVVAVGAVNRSGKKASISVSGAALDLMAPGEDIEGANHDGGYSSGTGTSDAAAMVSGAAALLRSKYPNMSATEVVERLESTATDKGAPGVDNDYGHGILNIVAALNEPTTAPSATTTSAAPAPTATTSAASPQAEPAGNKTPLIAGGVAVLVLLGGLVAFLLSRRRTGSAA
jgi:type VII secretion-associated serine protease mycosin